MDEGPPSIQVLHVEDDLDIAEVASEFLTRYDDRLEVQTAAGVDSALDQLASTEVDCIVSDYEMPGRNGIEFLEAVREKHPDLPFILFTGRGSEEIASEAISAGATDYLQKGMGTDQYELLANRLMNAVEQYRSSQRATHLDRVRSLVSTINQALVRAGSRGEIETRVCEAVSESDPYLFAWIGEVDAETDRIEPRASAGMEEGYLDAITVTADDRPTGHGPAGTAVRERRVAVSQNVADDSEFEPWRSEAMERGYQSVAGVPLEYEDTLYGVLVVYADRPHAFDADERTLLADLGNNISHAIHTFDVQEELREERQFIEQALDAHTDPFYVVAPDGTLSRWNARVPEVTGHTDEELAEMQAVDLFPEGERDRVANAIDEALSEGHSTVEADILSANGDRVPFELTGSRLNDSDDTLQGLIGIGRDIRERKRREQSIEEANAVLRTIIRNLPMGVLVEDTDREILMANDKVGEVLGTPADAEDLIGRDCARAAEEVKELFVDPDGFVGGIEDRIDERAPARNEQLEMADGRTLERDYVPFLLPEGEASLWIYRDVTEQKRRERAFEELHTATRELMTATSAEEVASIGSETATEVLRLPVNGIHLYDAGQETLEPAAWSDQAGALLGDPPPSLPLGGTLAGRVYRTGEPEIHGDVRQSDNVLNSETEFRSELQFPLGDHGVFLIASSKPDDFDRTDEVLARGLAANVEAALDRVEQRHELKRKRDRFETFASVISHDLRNPLNVALSRVEMALASGSVDHLDAVVDALGRMETQIDAVLGMARAGTDIEAADMETLSLESVANTCWGLSETGGGELHVTDDLEFQAAPDLVQHVFENLFRNSVEHNSGQVTIRAGPLPANDGFYVEDEGIGIPEEERKNVFESLYTSGAGDAGLGLHIVKTVVDAHGWNMSITDSDAGGARFEFRGVEASPTEHS